MEIEYLDTRNIIPYYNVIRPQGFWIISINQKKNVFFYVVNSCELF